MKSCVSVKWNWLFSKEQPGCSEGSRVTLAYPHTVWQHWTVLLSFSSTGLFLLSFPPLNHTNIILVLFSCKFFTVMGTSIALVRQHWHPFTQAAFAGSLHGLGTAEEKCPVAVKDQNVTTAHHWGWECEFVLIRAAGKNWNSAFCWEMWRVLKVSSNLFARRYCSGENIIIQLTLFWWSTFWLSLRFLGPFLDN